MSFECKNDGASQSHFREFRYSKISKGQHATPATRSAAAHQRLTITDEVPLQVHHGSPTLAVDVETLTDTLRSMRQISQGFGIGSIESNARRLRSSHRTRVNNLKKIPSGRSFLLLIEQRCTFCYSESSP